MNFEKIAEQVPALVLMVVVVTMFLKSQSKRDDAFLTFIETQNGKFKDLGDACHQVQNRASVAIEESTRMQGRLEKALEDASEKIHALAVERRREEQTRR